MGKQMAQKPINLEKYSGFHLTKSVGGGGDLAEFNQQT